MSDESKGRRGRPAGKSRCECSVIGYLEPDELERQLSALVGSGRIGHYWFVEHPADEDASKPHVHLRMTPPASRAVDWAALCDGVSQLVEGEEKPRKLVLSKGSVNDAWQDALLYARHEEGYCTVKGLVKATVNIPRERFRTDSAEWLDQIWTASDAYEPEGKRLSKEDICSLLEKSPEMSNRQLLVLVLRNNYTFGDYQLFQLYAKECKYEREAREREENKHSSTVD